jgi:hypothetical protein
MKSKFVSHLEQAIDNIRNDRSIASELLGDVSEYIGQNKERHKDVGQVAAKYLETLQRSNEQLVKLTAMLQRADDDEYGDLTEGDRDELFELFEEDGSNG